jgi:nicotinamidase-related amidase
MNIQRTELVIIDPQNDFHDQANAALPVSGAMQDAQRLSQLIKRNANRLDDIHVTLDTHQLVDIAHPIFWVDSKGKHPAPFTVLTRESVENGHWRSYNPQYQKRATEYVRALEKSGRDYLATSLFSWTLGA